MLQGTHMYPLIIEAETGRIPGFLRFVPGIIHAWLPLYPIEYIKSKKLLRESSVPSQGKTIFAINQGLITAR